NATKITSDKYKEIMETISTQAEDQFVSTAQKLRFEGVEEGIEKGIEKGIDKEKKEIAIKMISKGYSNKTIIELTNLKEIEVENIRKEYINQNK
ncbi:MAG: hypothetical protein U9N85_10920, partial [Bacteroidota bacterium]|nr:hypothetical protein [Bacteroidota bacterium]